MNKSVLSRRLLTIAHSYCVALNRRLANEMARVGAGEWEVTAVAPSFFHGDLRSVPLERIEGEACRVEAVPVRFSKRIHFMLYGRQLREIMREGWDVVHCWEEPFIFAGGQVARLVQPNTRLVYATFQNIPKSYPLPFNWIERRAMQRADGWVGFGQTVAETLMKKELYLSKPHSVIPLGVDTEVFKPDESEREKIRNALDWSASEPLVIGYLGRFVSEKGLSLLMRVFESLRGNWRALFVGSGPMERELHEWARKHDDRAKVITGVKHDEVPAYLNAMDVLCAPSQTTPQWREQLGRMLIEAFACGVPVVASDSGEIPFVVRDAGIVLPEKDETAWKNSLENLLENREIREELSLKGLERARSVYAWHHIARRHLEFFGELLETSERSAKA
jgi:glycosyltransferase involved in cell wall biosynthesis